jgi:hypothetical protein
MLFRKEITVYSENCAKQVNITVSGQNVDLLIIKVGGAYSYHWAGLTENMLTS